MPTCSVFMWHPQIKVECLWDGQSVRKCFSMVFRDPWENARRGWIVVRSEHRSRNIPPPAATRSAVRAARPEGRPPADSLLCFNMRHANAIVPEKYLIFDMQMRWSRKWFLTLPLNFWTSWQAVILVNRWILWCYRNARLPSLMKKHGSWQCCSLGLRLVILWYSMNK